MVAEIAELESLPSDIGPLLDASRAEGFDFIERLITDWDEVSNRFDRGGEVLLGARLDGRLVAVGGLNRDPYLEDPEVGRIRHVYVHPDARGRGVGRQLVAALVAHARARFRRVRLRAGHYGAGHFYTTMGFIATSEQDATHELAF